MVIGYGCKKHSIDYRWECFDVLANKNKKKQHQKTKGRNESFSLYVSFSCFQLVDWEIFKFLSVCFSNSSMVPVRDVFSITVKNVLKAAFRILTQMGRNSVIRQLSRQSYSSQIAVYLENAVGQIKQEDVSYSSYKPLFVLFSTCILL